MNQISKSKIPVSQEAKWQEKDIATAIEFASEHPEFDETFVISLDAQFKQKGYLTEKQHQALMNVIEKWGMDDA